MSITHRNQAVDIFRGLTMVFMVLVNNPGDYLFVYGPLKHANWRGFTPTDIVFPCFLFIVGISLQLSLMAKQQAEDNDRSILWHVFRRACVLFLLGLMDNGFPYHGLDTLRIPGVLQRIAVVCVLTTVVVLKLPRTMLPPVVVCLLLGYWMLLTLAPVPMTGKPNLVDPTANLSSWLDYRLLGSHLWLREQWDPEGILSTFPALCITLFGVMAAQRLQRQGNSRTDMARFAFCGVALLAGGMLWDHWFPIIRWLWTSSFILLSSGVAFTLLAGCMAAAETPALGRFNAVFVAFGANAIVLYMTSSLVAKTLYLVRAPGGGNLHDLLYEAIFASWLPPKAASLAWALALVLLMLGLAWTLYVRRIFIRV